VVGILSDDAIDPLRPWPRARDVREEDAATATSKVGGSARASSPYGSPNRPSESREDRNFTARVSKHAVEARALAGTYSAAPWGQFEGT